MFPAGTEPQQHYISVSAESSQEVAPDKVEIMLAVVSRGADPALLQEQNDKKLRMVKDKLLALGVPEANIKTVGYALDRWQEYNKTTETYEDRGYILSNSLRVVSYDTGKAGAIVKEAVQNGANEVSSIQFSLSDSAKKAVYDGLLAQATSQAKSKASSMASAAGVRISALASMSESYSYYDPLPYANYRMDAEAISSAGSAPSDISISAGLVKVKATVSASYEVEG